MKYQRKFKDPGEKWVDVSKESVLEHTEGSGYWLTGTVIDMLEDGQIVETPFALYRLSHTKGK